MKGVNSEQKRKKERELMRRLTMLVLALALSIPTQGTLVWAQEGSRDGGLTRPSREKGDKQGKRGGRKRERDEVQLAIRESRRSLQAAQEALGSGEKGKAQEAAGGVVKVLAELEKNAPGPEARKVAAGLRQESEQAVKSLQGEKATGDLLANLGAKVRRALFLEFRFARAKDQVTGGKSEQASQELSRVAEFLHRQKMLLEGAERRPLMEAQAETEALADRLQKGEAVDAKVVDLLAQKVAKVAKSVPTSPFTPRRKGQKEREGGVSDDR
jgi:hypothetical protein